MKIKLAALACLFVFGCKARTFNNSESSPADMIRKTSGGKVELIGVDNQLIYRGNCLREPYDAKNCPREMVLPLDTVSKYLKAIESESTGAKIARDQAQSQVDALAETPDDNKYIKAVKSFLRQKPEARLKDEESRIKALKNVKLSAEKIVQDLKSPKIVDHRGDLDNESYFISGLFKDHVFEKYSERSDVPLGELKSAGWEIEVYVHLKKTVFENKKASMNFPHATCTFLSATDIRAASLILYSNQEGVEPMTFAESDSVMTVALKAGYFGENSDTRFDVKMSCKSNSGKLTFGKLAAFRSASRNEDYFTVR